MVDVDHSSQPGEAGTISQPTPRCSVESQRAARGAQTEEDAAESPRQKMGPWPFW